MRFTTSFRNVPIIALGCLMLIALQLLNAEDAEPQAAWAPKMGDVFDLKARIAQTGMDGKTRVARVSEYSFELKIVQVSESGAADAQLRIAAVKVSGVIDGKSAEFDSQTAGAEPDPKNLLAFMGGLVGKAIPLAITRNGAGDLLPAVMNLGVQASPFLPDLNELLEFVFNFPQAGEGKQEKTWKKFVTVPLGETFKGAPSAMEERKFEIGRVGGHGDDKVLNVTINSALCKGAGPDTGAIGTTGLEGGQQDPDKPKDKKDKPPAPPQGKGSGFYKIAVEGWLSAGEMQRTITATIDKRSLRLDTAISVKVTKQE